MSRLGLNDTGIAMLAKMAEGNPGAMDALLAILAKHDEIDPQAFMGGIGAINRLDTLEIYGTDIYVLYSDKCGKDVRRMLMLMRATQLGLFSHTKLQQMAHDQMGVVNLTEEEFRELDANVCDFLEGFAKESKEGL